MLIKLPQPAANARALEKPNESVPVQSDCGTSGNAERFVRLARPIVSLTNAEIRDLVRLVFSSAK